MRVILIIVCQYCFLFGYPQVSTKGELINKSINFYESNQNGCYLVTHKFKSAIAEDTSKAEFLCCLIKDDNEIKYLVKEMSSGSAFLYLNNEFYTVYSKANKYKKHKKNTWENLNHRKFVEDYPYYDSKNFLKKLSDQSLFFSNDSISVISQKSFSFFFDSQSGRLIRVRQSLPTPSGLQFMETVINTLITEKEKLDSMFDFSFLATYSEDLDASQSIKPLIGKQNIGTKFPAYKLKTNTGEILTNQSLTGKFILFDLFYQSCMPCIKSIPYLNELSDTIKFPKLKVVGVDPVLSDSINMHKFIERYKIQYSIVTGQSAKEFWRLIKNQGYPFLILLNPKGEIIFVEDEYNAKFLSKKIKDLIEK